MLLPKNVGPEQVEAAYEKLGLLHPCEHIWKSTSVFWPWEARGVDPSLRLEDRMVRVGCQCREKEAPQGFWTPRMLYVEWDRRLGKTTRAAVVSALALLQGERVVWVCQTRAMGQYAARVVYENLLALAPEQGGDPLGQWKMKVRGEIHFAEQVSGADKEPGCRARRRFVLRPLTTLEKSGLPARLPGEPRPYVVYDLC